MARRGRELQFATHQLVGVFLGLIALCAFVFLLGVSMGSKKTALAAKAGEKAADLATPRNAIQAELEAHARTGGAAVKLPVGALDAGKTGPSAVPSEKAANPPADKTAAKPETKPGLKPAENLADTPLDKPLDKPGSKPAEKIADKTSDKPSEKAPAKPADKPATEPDAKKAVAGASWYVQIAAVDEKPAAETMVRKLEKDGFEAQVFEPTSRDKRAVYRVRVGPFPSKAEADRAKVRLAEASKKKNPDYFLVKG